MATLIRGPVGPVVYAGMVKKSGNRPSKAAAAAPMLALLDQMETLISEMDLDWPQEDRAEVRRRLTRLERAVRVARRGGED